MERSAKLAIGAVGAALALGVLGDVALRATPWGTSVPLCAIALTGAIAVLARLDRRAPSRAVVILATTFVVCAAGFAWRASQTLLMLDTVALTGLLALLAMRWHGAGLAAAGIVAYGEGTIGTVVRTGTGLPRLVTAVPWATLGRGRGRPVTQVGIGVLVALPLLILFGVLFADADPVFRTLARRLVDVDPATIFSHVAATAWWTWLVGGFLWGLFVWRGRSAPSAPTAEPALAPAAVITALGLLAALFLTFVVVQLRFLFGGSDLVLSTTGLTYAEYARQGFFQLVAAAALTLPILLAANSQVPPGTERRGRQSVHAISIVLLGLLAVVLVSAAVRLRLYVAAYGMSEARIYAAAIMAWLVVAFAWFGVTVLRDHPERFVIGTVVGALAALAVLFVIDPPALVARHDLARAAAGRDFDVKYVTALGPDAIPALVAGIAQLGPGDRCAVARRLEQSGTALDGYDWRSWSVSAARAAAALAEHRGDLQAIRRACPSP